MATSRSKTTPVSAAVSVSYGLPHAGLPTDKDFKVWVSAAARGRRSSAEVSIRIVDAVEGQALNMRYRHKDYPTNVLAFVADLPPKLKLALLGDIVLCAPVVEKEALAQGKPLFNHYAHLTVHGVLHLLGLGHETIAEAREMESVEQQVLELIGISDPYLER